MKVNTTKYNKHFKIALKKTRQHEHPSKDNGNYFKSQLLEDSTWFKRVTFPIQVQHDTVRSRGRSVMRNAHLPPLKAKQHQIMEACYYCYCDAGTLGYSYLWKILINLRDSPVRQLVALKQWRQRNWKEKRREERKRKLLLKRDFPSGPVAKTSRSQHKGSGFDPWSGN